MAGMFPGSGVPSQEAINSLPDPNTNCQVDELWYSTNRCAPRFDPAAANAVLSELLNLVQCAGLQYDCTRLDNLCTAMKDLILDVLFGCLPRTFPTATGACTIEQIVLTTDTTGCKRFATYSQSAALIGYALDNSVWGTNYPITLHPRFPTDPNTFYNRQQLALDQIAGTVDETKLIDNHTVSMSMNVACDNSLIRLEYGSAIYFEPARNQPNGCSSNFCIRVNGQFPLYPNNAVYAFPAWSNYEGGYNASHDLWLNKGTHKVDVYITAASGTKPPARTLIVGATNNNGNGISARLSVK